MSDPARPTPAVIEVTCGLIERDGRVLVARRAPGRALAGKWEFPGGKLESGETPPACLARELREELGIDVCVGATLPPCEHDYGDRIIRLLPFRCTIRAGEPYPHEHEAVRWCTLAEVAALDLAAADLPVLEHYRRVVG